MSDRHEYYASESAKAQADIKAEEDYNQAVADLQPGFNDLLLSDEEITDIIIANDTILSKTKRNRALMLERVKNDGQLVKAIAKAQLAHCEPIIRAGERAKTLREVGEDLCVLCGNLLLENKELGKLVTDALSPILKKYHLEVYPDNLKQGVIYHE